MAERKAAPEKLKTIIRQPVQKNIIGLFPFEIRENCTNDEYHHDFPR